MSAELELVVELAVVVLAQELQEQVREMAWEEVAWFPKWVEQSQSLLVPQETWRAGLVCRTLRWKTSIARVLRTLERIGPLRVRLGKARWTCSPLCKTAKQLVRAFLPLLVVVLAAHRPQRRLWTALAWKWKSYGSIQWKTSRGPLGAECASFLGEQVVEEKSRPIPWAAEETNLQWRTSFQFDEDQHAALAAACWQAKDSSSSFRAALALLDPRSVEGGGGVSLEQVLQLQREQEKGLAAVRGIHQVAWLV